MWDFYILSPDEKIFHTTIEVNNYLDENPNVKCDQSVTNTHIPTDWYEKLTKNDENNENLENDIDSDEPPQLAIRSNQYNSDALYKLEFYKYCDLCPKGKEERFFNSELLIKHQKYDCVNMKKFDWENYNKDITRKAEEYCNKRILSKKAKSLIKESENLCALCFTSFDTKKLLKEHVNTYHLKKSKEKNNVKKHKRFLNEVPNTAIVKCIANQKCQICGTKFDSMAKALEHVQTYHSDAMLQPTSQPVFESMENEEITDINSKKDDIELLEGNNLDNFPIAPIDIKQELLISSVSRHCD